mmetsp:Transcript_43990/g.61834  ORF Transcript_43990/g.61834 Transcript_43990/m.61834 type:complete len:184 (+) Transcript_43990:10-561(+)|eukprot:CAMPEP_0201487354 /NCGR_PEP_ID=MMETSP0151_2-20130828/12523_1 /ASSEMBLY_ACC=CAM_ASM_000257 /TAXON_ID=200890 /ORGANISM="Paramoeba atlantica, Strain 621/1 / CCAP 1560/9" /LENGTH=183 /DNA_ID=CAMNT_0047872359 /DNA_START=14 /DNA_END=565 /DNA_ORIENTATION=+
MADSSKENRKRAGEEADGAPASKRAKPSYTLNANFALDKVHETKPLHEIIKLPPSALQGLADRADQMLKKFKITTIEELAHWKFYEISKAIVVLATVEEDGKRCGESEMNLNAALDKDFETKSFKEIAKSSPSCLSGLADWVDSTLKDFHIKTVADLATWKYCVWAEALVAASHFENTDHSSR